jgi:hypothetical protein
MPDSTSRIRWVAVMPMTQQYLCGELAQRLAQLESAAAGQAHCRAVHQLRRDAESSPPSALGAVARQALLLADAMCWDALQQGDVSTFSHETAIAAELYEFATCARLLDA